jgi:hypothetical protein
MIPRGLSTDQAPPLAVPVQFHAMVPVAFVLAGLALGHAGLAGLASTWLPAALAVVHVLTLGGLGAAMLGSMYQMVPVVAGQPVPAPRLSHVVAPLLLVGATAFPVGLATSSPAWVSAGGIALAAAFGLALPPLALALARSQVASDTVLGLRFGVVAWTLLVLLGLRLAWFHAGGAVPPDRIAWLLAHAGLGVFGVVGGLVAAVSWLVLPMFFLTPALPPRVTRALTLVLGLAPLLALALALGGLGAPWVALALAPAVLAAWGVHPVLQLRAIAQRKRRRPDPTLDLWRAALGAGLLGLPLAVVYAATDWPPAGPLLGFVALWGWALGIVHAMLTRIVPFMVWFHAVARTPDITQVPPMKQLWPDADTRRAGRTHVVTLVLGTAGLAAGSDALLRLTAAGMSLTGVWLGVSMARAVRRGVVP